LGPERVVDWCFVVDMSEVLLPSTRRGNVRGQLVCLVWLGSSLVVVW
jgi:hypothetical protein